MKYTGSATGDRALQEWEQFITAVQIRLRSTTVSNTHTGRFEWMWPHSFFGINHIVKSGRAFDTPVQVYSCTGQLHRIALYADGTLCERMNNRDPAVLDLTFQNFSEDDLEYSDKVFQQLFASAEEDFEYKPLCPIAQARIYNLLVNMTRPGSPAHSLIHNLETGNGALALYNLRREFSGERPTEQLSAITAFRSEPKQNPGQSVRSYILGCRKFYNRLIKLIPDANQRWETLISASVMRGVHPQLRTAVEKFTEEASLLAAQRGIVPKFDLSTVERYLQQAQDANRFNQGQENSSSRQYRPKAFLAHEEDDPDMPELADEADLADDETNLQDLADSCPPAAADALLVLVGAMCYWCGKKGHIVKDCRTKCPDCGAMPDTAPGAKSAHRPNCPQTTFLKNKAESRRARQPASGAPPKQPYKKKTGFRNWKTVQPGEASRFGKAWNKARRIKPGSRTREQREICNFGESLGLCEDDELTENDDESDGDPDDQCGVAETEDASLVFMCGL